MHAGIELHWAYWLLVFLGLLWLAASLVVGWIRGEDNDATGFLQWVLAHKTVAGSIAVVYLSAAGLVHETLFYSSFGLIATRYVDPGGLAYCVTNGLN